MKFKSLVFAQASGSIGGITYSRNKGGMYVRSRATPTNPNTAAQVRVRNALKDLTTSWNNTLTAAQQQAWAIYAANVPLLNRLGDSRPIPALSMFIRCNSPRLQFEGPTKVIDDGPTTMSLATMTAPVLSLPATDFSVAFTNTDSWATEAGGFMWIFVSKPQSTGVNFYKGPYQFLGHIVGAATPPTSPVTFAPPYTLPNTVNNYFWRVRVGRADGRISTDVTGMFQA